MEACLLRCGCGEALLPRSRLPLKRYNRLCAAVFPPPEVAAELSWDEPPGAMARACAALAAYCAANRWRLGKVARRLRRKAVDATKYPSPQPWLAAVSARAFAVLIEDDVIASALPLLAPDALATCEAILAVPPGRVGGYTLHASAARLLAKVVARLDGPGALLARAERSVPALAGAARQEGEGRTAAVACFAAIAALYARAQHISPCVGTVVAAALEVLAGALPVLAADAAADPAVARVQLTTGAGSVAADTGGVVLELGGAATVTDPAVEPALASLLALARLSRDAVASGRVFRAAFAYLDAADAWRTRSDLVAAVMDVFALGLSETQEEHVLVGALARHAIDAEGLSPESRVTVVEAVTRVARTHRADSCAASAVHGVRELAGLYMPGRAVVREDREDTLSIPRSFSGFSSKGSVSNSVAGPLDSRVAVRQLLHHGRDPLQEALFDCFEALTDCLTGALDVLAAAAAVLESLPAPPAAYNALETVATITLLAASRPDLPGNAAPWRGAAPDALLTQVARVLSVDDMRARIRAIAILDALVSSRPASSHASLLSESQGLQLLGSILQPAQSAENNVASICALERTFSVVLTSAPLYGTIVVEAARLALTLDALAPAGMVGARMRMLSCAMLLHIGTATGASELVRVARGAWRQHADAAGLVLGPDRLLSADVVAAAEVPQDVPSMTSPLNALVEACTRSLAPGSWLRQTEALRHLLMTPFAPVSSPTLWPSQEWAATWVPVVDRIYAHVLATGEAEVTNTSAVAVAPALEVAAVPGIDLLMSPSFAPLPATPQGPAVPPAKRSLGFTVGRLPPPQATSGACDPVRLPTVTWQKHAAAAC